MGGIDRTKGSGSSAEGKKGNKSNAVWNGQIDNDSNAWDASIFGKFDRPKPVRKSKKSRRGKKRVVKKIKRTFFKSPFKNSFKRKSKKTLRLKKQKRL